MAVFVWRKIRIKTAAHLLFECLSIIKHQMAAIKNRDELVKLPLRNLAL
ncbi:MAG: hypothetical protein H7336_00080 [Bacteriovorax sp.]|nr:hypothetical protein [Bacteriovorax sp.]